MKNFLKLTVVILVFAANGNTMEYTADVEKVSNNYLISLNHKNPGVVESAVKYVIILKIYYPEYNYSNLINKLNELTTEGATKSIRLKAMIAGDFLKNFDDFKWIQKGDYEKGDDIFNLYLNNASNTLSLKNY